MTRTRKSAIRIKATEAGWPMPVWPPVGAPAEVVREWTRLYRRLRWALRTEIDLIANVQPGAKLARLRVAAKHRGLEVELALRDYEELIAANRCHYCGAALPETGHGVDRKDASVGYTLDNVVVACDACNRIKADIFTYEQMVEIGRLLRSWRAEGRWKDPQRKDGRRFGGRPPKGDLRREIEEWNKRWLQAPGVDASGLPADGVLGNDDGSGIVREGARTYAVEADWSDGPDELDDPCTPAMDPAGAVAGLETDWALGGARVG